MLKRLSSAEKFSLLVANYAAAIQKAFLTAIYEIRSSITLSLVINRIEANDVDGAIRAMNIEAPAFNPVLDEIAKAYTGGGSATIDDLPAIANAEGFKIALRFDARNPVAEAYLNDHSATLVKGIVDDQITAIRSALVAGTAKGIGARQIALDLVGRINTATGQREGGVIGLTSSQADWVRNYEVELDNLDGNALTRSLRDRRFDKMVAKAIAENKRLPQATVDKMVTAYKNRSLRYRGEAIGRSESLTAFNAASDEAMRQNIANGKISAALVDGKWNTIMDGRERDSHAAMDGQIQAFGRPFTSGAGAQLRYPGDPLAPASERINCRCTRTFIIRKQSAGTVH